MTQIKKYNSTSKSYHLCLFLQTYGVNYDNTDEIENIQPLNKLGKILANFNTKSCNGKIDKLVKTNDIINNIGFRIINNSFILKSRIINELEE